MTLDAHQRTAVSKIAGLTIMNALVILAAAAVAVVLIAWAKSSGKLPAFFDRIIDDAPAVRPRHSERGSAAVEFALVLPILLVIALAMVQVGLFARDRLLMEAAARAGARGR